MRKLALSIITMLVPMLASARNNNIVEVNGIIILTNHINDYMAFVTENSNNYSGEIIIPDFLEYNGIYLKSDIVSLQNTFEQLGKDLYGFTLDDIPVNLEYTSASHTKVQTIQTELISENADDIESINEELEKVEIPYNDFIKLKNDADDFFITSSDVSGRTIDVYNPYKDVFANQYMGQLHCHSWNSPYFDPEGTTHTKAYVEALFNIYKNKGYDFLTVTNYQYYDDLTTNPYPNDTALLWLTNSYEQVFSKNDAEGLPSTHIIMLNAKRVLHNPAVVINPKTAFKEAFDDGIVTQLAHPMWWVQDGGTLWDDTALSKIKDKTLRFVEIYNGYCILQGQIAEPYITQGSDHALDVLASNGLFVFGTAVSDSHGTNPNSELGGVNQFEAGVINVFASAKTQTSIMESILKGNFYSSEHISAKLSSVSLDDGKLVIGTNDSDASTKFIGYNGTLLDTVTGANPSYDIKGDEVYVRAIVTLSSGKKCWTNPIYISNNIYKLTYIIDGEEYKSYEIEYGAAITPETAPTREGYTFSGWSEIPETMPARDITITGSFNINRYKLTYMLDGEEYKSYEIEYGAAITPEPAPTREGYTFSGWSEIPETMPFKDVTVVGTFTMNEQAKEFYVDNVTYVITGEGTVTIVGSDQKGSVEIKSTIDINGDTYNVIVIAENAFKDNQDITSVTIADGISTIGDNAFNGCISLIKINLGKDVSSIGSKAFANVGTKSAIRTSGEDNSVIVNCYAESVPQTADDAFENTPIETGRLLVADATVNAYKTTSPWNRFGTITGFEEYVGIERISIDTDDARHIYDMRGNRLSKVKEGVNISHEKNGESRKYVFK